MIVPRRWFLKHILLFLGEICPPPPPPAEAAEGIYRCLPSAASAGGGGGGRPSATSAGGGGGGSAPSATPAGGGGGGHISPKNSNICFKNHRLGTIIRCYKDVDSWHIYRLLHILRRSDRMGMTMCNSFYCGVTNDLADRWCERVTPTKQPWQGSILLASGVLFNRNCGLELSPEGLVRAGFMDELSEFPPASGTNMEIVNNQCNDGRIHQGRSSIVLGLTSFDSPKTADEIMRIGSERGENVARLENSQGKMLDQSTDRGSRLSAVVNSILSGDSCDIYVRCGVISRN